MSNFLPEDYKQPQGGGAYTKLSQGENRIRIISNSIIGWEAWTHENKPIRVRPDQKILLDSRSDLKDKPRHFWAFLIWNYKNQQIEIFEITQKTIQDGILALYHSSDWGDPKGYDITITKQGEGMDTTYNTQGAPKSQFEPEKVKKTFHDKPCNIEELYNGNDPFDLDDVMKATVIEKFDKEFNDLAF